MADDVHTLRREMLVIAKRIKRHIADKREGQTVTVVEDDALALAERVVKLEELTVAKKFDVSDAG